MADSFWGRSTRPSVAARLMAAVGVVGVCIVGAAGTVGTALAQEARDWQGDAIGRGISGLERLGRTLGLDGFGGEVGEVMPGSGQSIIAALCRIARR